MSNCACELAASTDVMRQWSIPQGTIHSNGWRSLLTLIAKPCVVTPRLTWTPIERDLARLVRPHAGQPLDRAGLDADVGERGDDRALHAADVLVHVVAGRACRLMIG